MAKTYGKRDKINIFEQNSIIEIKPIMHVIKHDIHMSCLHA